MPVYVEEVEFRGHAMVRSMHRNTIEVTRDAHLSQRGDCIIGVLADKGPSDLSSQVRDTLRTDGSLVSVAISVDGSDAIFRFSAAGSGALTLESREEMVIRKSAFVSPRTLAVHSDAAAKDVPRVLIERLRSPAARGTLRLEVRLP